MLAVDNLTAEFGEWRGQYDLHVPSGALCALIGGSGGGKTTLLHMIAGFAAPVAGTLTFDGRDLIALAPAARPLSIMFQEHNLFPHLNAADNIGLGLSPSLRLDAEQRRAIEGALERVGLSGLGPRKPAQLSGGQRQRVALARILVRRRPLVLLDEPFSGLDPALRADMIALVDELRRENGLTVVMVLHTPEEAAGVADMMASVREGRVQSAGGPEEVLDGLRRGRPASTAGDPLQS